MATIKVYMKRTDEEKEQIAKQIEDWFEQHTDREDCVVDLFGDGSGTVIRRGHVLEDLENAC